jgi:hypothetical protein
MKQGRVNQSALENGLHALEEWLARIFYTKDWFASLLR